jgi:hypothetical protein
MVLSVLIYKVAEYPTSDFIINVQCFMHTAKQKCKIMIMCITRKQASIICDISQLSLTS